MWAVPFDEVALVLIVVDEPETLLGLCRDVEAGGDRAVLAADADVAIERLAAMPIDVVIIDVTMPVQDGWAVLEALRDRVQPLPAIVISGRASSDELDRAHRLGAIASVSAPFSPAQLHRAVARAQAPAS